MLDEIYFYEKKKKIRKKRTLVNLVIAETKNKMNYVPIANFWHGAIFEKTWYISIIILHVRQNRWIMQSEQAVKIRKRLLPICTYF